MERRLHSLVFLQFLAKYRSIQSTRLEERSLKRESGMFKIRDPPFLGWCTGNTESDFSAEGAALVVPWRQESLAGGWHILHLLSSTSFQTKLPVLKGTAACSSHSHTMVVSMWASIDQDVHGPWATCPLEHLHLFPDSTGKRNTKPAAIFIQSQSAMTPALCPPS